MTRQSWILAFVRREDGPTAVEYAVMAGFVVLAIAAAARGLGQAVSGYFSNVLSAIN
jgi:pilus assembly protein Flp/PilA